MKTPSSEHVENMLCTEIVFDIQNIFFNNMFSPCFAKRTVSDKDLPVFGICYFGELEIPVFSDIIPPLSESFRDEKDHNFDTKESI